MTSTNLLPVLGAILVVLGAAGGLTYNGWLPINNDAWRIVLVTFGSIIAVGSITMIAYSALRQNSGKALAKRYIKSLGIKIVYPENNSVVVGRVDVQGTISKALPNGYELRILRGYPRGGFVPHVQSLCDDDKKEWFVQQFDIGGEKGDRRTIEAWLVGPDGTLLLETWLSAHQIHRDTMSQLETYASAVHGTFLEPIKHATSDMYRCAVIKVSKG